MGTILEQKPRFDRKAVVAWMLDLDGGYRSSVERTWRFSKLSEAPHAKLNRWQDQVLELTTLLGAEANVPPVRLEPISEDRVRVSSPFRLVAQSYDEHLPRSVEGSVEVSYGSVVRAGPLLFSVLYTEQLDSMDRGRFALPFVGGSLDSGATGDDAEGTRRLEERSKVLRLWKLVFGTAVILAGLSGVALALGRGYHFRYGNSPLDTLAACIACAVLAWTALLVVCLPIQKLIVSWVYTGSDGEGSKNGENGASRI